MDLSKLCEWLKALLNMKINSNNNQGGKGDGNVNQRGDGNIGSITINGSIINIYPMNDQRKIGEVWSYVKNDIPIHTSSDPKSDVFWLHADRCKGPEFFHFGRYCSCQVDDNPVRFWVGECKISGVEEERPFDGLHHLRVGECKISGVEEGLYIWLPKQDSRGRDNVCGQSFHVDGFYIPIVTAKDEKKSAADIQNIFESQLRKMLEELQNKK